MLGARMLRQLRIPHLSGTIRRRIFSSAAQQARQQQTAARQRHSVPKREESEATAMIDLKYHWHFKGVMFVCIGFAAWHVLPFAYGATVPVSVRLCRSKDPFMQRSGVSRLKMLAANSNLRQTIIVEGTDAMVRLLRVSEEEDVLKQVLEIITKLARESADDERELMCLDEPVAAAQAIAANARWSPELREMAVAAATALETRDGSISDPEKPLI